MLENNDDKDNEVNNDGDSNKDDNNNNYDDNDLKERYSGCNDRKTLGSLVGVGC